MEQNDEDDTGLGQLHDQLQQLDIGNQQQIIDDQNLNLDPNSSSKNQEQLDDDEDEGQHYLEEDEEDMMQLEQEMDEDQYGQELDP